MLTEEEKSEILREIEHYPRRQAAGVAALRIVQKHRGWVPEVGEIAGLLGMTPAELEGVATFYNSIFLKPLGRHVIFICDSISCWISGYDLLRAHLQDRLGIKPGETSPDGRFTLLAISCLGICHEAPAMMIDEKLYTKLDKEKIDALLEQYG